MKTRFVAAYKYTWQNSPAGLFCVGCAWEESNFRPPHYQCGALTTELHALIAKPYTLVLIPPADRG